MKNLIVLLLVVASLFSCNKREVKVPIVAFQGEEEVANHSAIWMFYDDEGKLDLNEKNRISSTNWFFNVDKKLSLNEVLPEVARLLVKHNKKSPHNTAPMNNYFSYVNSLNKHLSFYSFDSIKYKFIDKNKLPKFVGDTLLVSINSSKFTIPANEKETIIQMAFDEEINFQNYLEAKLKIETELGKEKISRIEYILSK